jgi:hypothetical protein
MGAALADTQEIIEGEAPCGFAVMELQMLLKARRFLPQDSSWWLLELHTEHYNVNAWASS